MTRKSAKSLGLIGRNVVTNWFKTGIVPTKSKFGRDRPRPLFSQRATNEPSPESELLLLMIMTGRCMDEDVPALWNTTRALDTVNFVGETGQVCKSFQNRKTKFFSQVPFGGSFCPWPLFADGSRPKQ